MTTSITDLLEARRSHLARLATTNGASGETSVLSVSENWVPRPKGKQSKNLRSVLEESGIKIKLTSFDMIYLPAGCTANFDSVEDLRKVLPDMIFIEVKTATQERVKADFTNFFFAFTENEISAASQLGARYKVALYNSRTKELVISSLQDIMARAGSTTWQVSIQLKSVTPDAST